MKKLIYTVKFILIMLAYDQLNAQIGIGTTVLTNSSVLLEFGADSTGIILPQVTSATNAAAGTFLFDAADKSVKMKEDKNNSLNGNWTNLTQNSIQGKLHSFSNAGVDQIGNNGVVMGSFTSSKSGALVLESTTRALVLPKVNNPQNALKGSIAGTMVYDTASGMLAVFDGSTWSYWK